MAVKRSPADIRRMLDEDARQTSQEVLMKANSSNKVGFKPAKTVKA